MISSFTIGNFKAFGPPQTIPLKPITLIFGPNSAGKSSVIHSLLFAHEANLSGKLDIFKTQLGGESVDMGGFRQFTHRSLPENRVVLTFQIPLLKSANSETWNLNAVTVTATYGIRGVDEKAQDDPDKEFFDFEPAPDAPFGKVFEHRRLMELFMAKVSAQGDDPPALLSYEIAVAGEPLLRASRKGGRVKMDAIFVQHPALQDYLRNLILAVSLATEVTEETLALARELIGEITQKLELEMGGLLPKSLPRMEGEHDPADIISTFKLLDTDARHTLGTVISYNFGRLIEMVYDEVAGFLDRFRYLGPLRSNPPRHLAFSEDTSGSQSEGSFAWKAVRDNAELRGKVNEWFGKDFLQTTYELGVDNLISSSLTADALEVAIEEVIHEKYSEWDEARERKGDARADEIYFNPYEAWDSKLVLKKLLRDIFARTAAGAVGELTLRDKRNQAYVSHRDIGIGVSQVLPVLAHAYTAKEDVIAIEQPEIHLHPALQSELADVFIESALGPQRNRFILETHSEHLILRILRRIRETRLKRLPAGCLPIQPEDVSILYVQPNENGSEVRVMRVDPMGKIVDQWPGGFFEESFKELF